MVEDDVAIQNLLTDIYRKLFEDHGIKLDREELLSLSILAIRMSIS